MDWLDTINSIARGIASLCKWPDNFKIESAHAYLEGPAKQWFIGRSFISCNDF